MKADHADGKVQAKEKFSDLMSCFTWLIEAKWWQSCGILLPPYVHDYVKRITLVMHSSL